MLFRSGVEINSEAQSGLYVEIEKPNGDVVASGGFMPASGINRAQKSISIYQGIIEPGDYKIRISVGFSHKIKILAIWLE